MSSDHRPDRPRQHANSHQPTLSLWHPGTHTLVCPYNLLSLPSERNCIYALLKTYFFSLSLPPPPVVLLLVSLALFVFCIKAVSQRQDEGISLWHSPGTKTTFQLQNREMVSINLCSVLFMHWAHFVDQKQEQNTLYCNIIWLVIYFLSISGGCEDHWQNPAKPH